MKIIVVFLLCLVGALADSTTTSSKDDEWIACIVEIALNPNMMSSKSPTEDQRNCYLACMYRKIGYMKKDGTLNVESILSNSTGEKRIEDRKKLIGIIETCKLQAGDDACKKARCYQDHRLRLSNVYSYNI